jgi:hypothetical protein
MNKYLILLFLSLTVLANPFEKLRPQRPNDLQIYQVDKNADISSLPGNHHHLSDHQRENGKDSLPRDERDAILQKYIPKELSKMDELDRDLFYKRAIYYTQEKFMDKYEGMISVDDYKKLAKELEWYK